MVYPRDSSLGVRIDEDIVDLFHRIKPPGAMADVQKELVANKMTPAVRARSRLELAEASEKQRKAKKAPRPIKYTNVHLPELFEGA